MAFTKAHIFNPHDYHFSLICHALAHPARIVIIKKLLKEGKCQVKKLNQSIPLSKPTLSQHLRMLLSMNIIQCEEKYPTVWYEINEDLNLTIKIIELILFSQINQFSLGNKSEISWIEKFRNLDAKGNSSEDKLEEQSGPSI